jgi:hypothetical protein
MNIRAKFEEIWPVPNGVYWRDSKGQYGCDNHTYEDAMDTHNIRLDTFTRCQETTDVYVSLVEDLIEDIESLADWTNSTSEKKMVAGIIDRAKQIMEQKK